MPEGSDAMPEERWFLHITVHNKTLPLTLSLSLKNRESQTVIPCFLGMISTCSGTHPLLTLLLMYAGLRVAGVAGILLFPFLGTVGVQLYKQGLLFNTKSEA